jgi:hypothetical protein
MENYIMKSIKILFVMCMVYWNVFSMPVDAELVHRWGFNNGWAGDLVGHSDAILKGKAKITGNALDLSSNNGTSDPNNVNAAWAELPIQQTLAGMKSGSFEIWARYGTLLYNSRTFSCGYAVSDDVYNASNNELFMIINHSYSGQKPLLAGIMTQGFQGHTWLYKSWSSGQTHYIAITFDKDANAIDLYVDGAYVMAKSLPLVPGDIPNMSNAPCYLGRFCRSSSTTIPLFNGFIDEFRIYDGVLSSSDIAAHYSSGPNDQSVNPNTTTTYETVDDFEFYPQNSVYPQNSLLWSVWKDSLHGGNNSGSQIYLDSVLPDMNALKFVYDNNGTNYGSDYYSEIVRNYDMNDPKSDWTRNGAAALTLYFYGEPSNSLESIYVALADQAGHFQQVMFNGDPNEIRSSYRCEWNIDLTNFNNINLAHIKQFYIGIGNRANAGKGAGGIPSGTGTLWFDDIRLYPPRCKPEMTAASFNDDCTTDIYDLWILASAWLTTDSNTSGLTGWYKFEGNPNDSSGNGHNGVFIGDANTVGGVLSLNGNGDGVDCGDWDPSARAGELTIALRAYWKGTNSRNQILLTRRNYWGPGGAAWQLFLPADSNQLIFGNADYGLVDFGGVTLPKNTWTHVAVTFDGNNATLYLNGSYQAAAALGLARADGAHCIIGAGNSLGAESFNGDLDDVRLYDFALFGSEIASINDGGPGNVRNSWYSPVLSPANPYNSEPRYQRSVNLHDFCILAKMWLQEQLWPTMNN